MADTDLLRVLVVDDTSLYRKIISDILSELPNVEVVATASNGKIAISKISLLKPDLLILDIKMPEMNGLEVLTHLKAEASDVGIIILSSIAQHDGEETIKALELGAFDFITKPQSESMEKNREILKNTLAIKLKAFTRSTEIKNILKKPPHFSKFKSEKKMPSNDISLVQRKETITDFKREKSEIVAIGISTGGPWSLLQMMPKLPFDLGIPIFIVQHMPPNFTQALANRLDSQCPYNVKEAEDGELVQPNMAFIAPGGKQMKVTTSSDEATIIIRITDDPPMNNCKPSADYLFRSIAPLYKNRATGVIMSGMGSDGTLGLKLMKQFGATIIAQDESTSVVFGMPKESIKAGIVDVIAPLHMIAEEISRTVR